MTSPRKHPSPPFSNPAKPTARTEEQNDPWTSWEPGGCMGADSGVDLIHMAAADSSVRLRVLGRHRPGETPYNDYLDAELTVASGFATGRLKFSLSPEDLDAWSVALDKLAAGRGIYWLRNPEIRIDLDRQFSESVPIVTVADDESVSSVSVWMDVGQGWIDDLRDRFDLVRRTWLIKGGTSSRPRIHWR
ncbi:DUF5959 family protein [Streptomyces sp. NPDC096132]|uniref:DUF5959 family protein n=1 Tax=Streptomyces sp. NPDC096132 TaxID=3366075 RepID=UPI0037F80089